MGELRRDKGTGSRAFLMADGRYIAFVTLPSGKRKAVYGRTAKACEAKRDDLVRQVMAGVDPSALPLDVFLERYLARRLNLGPDSVERYGLLLKQIRKSDARDDRGKRIADKPIVRLSTDDIEALYADRQRAGMAPKTIGLLHTFLHGALEQATVRGKIIRNPANGAERPTIHRTVPTVLDGEMLRRLMDRAEGHRLEAYVAIIATTGIRPGELLALTWTAVDWQRGVLVIADPEKGGVPRSIPLVPRAVRALRSQRVRVAEMRLLRAGAWNDEDRVFPGTWGGTMDPSAAARRMGEMGQELGVKVNPRILRHSVATELLRRGVPMKVVQELLGHRSMKQTSDVYSHVSPSMMASAMAAMSQAVGE